jgi:glycosyltransferase involved in cell wall biosynthesis
MSMDRRLILEAEGCANADVVHCVSNSVANDVRQAYGLPKGKIKVIPNGVDTDIYSPPSDADKGVIDEVLAKYNLRPPFILSSGRFVIEKGHKELVRAFVPFHKNHPEYSLAIFGFSGYTHGELMGARDKLPHETRRNVVIVNKDARDDLPYLYKACDIAAFPSHTEAFGLIAVESAACGKPIVVGDTGGLREIVNDEVNGKIGARVDGRDPQSIASGLEMAAQNKEKWGPAAREYAVKNFSWMEVARKYVEMYDGLVK